MFHTKFRTKIEGLTLIYRVIRQTHEDETFYSIEITEIFQKKRSPYTLRNVATTKRKAGKIARFFCENTVTPEHADAIFEEWFASPQNVILP